MSRTCFSQVLLSIFGTLMSAPDILVTPSLKYHDHNSQLDTFKQTICKQYSATKLSIIHYPLFVICYSCCVRCPPPRMSASDMLSPYLHVYHTLTCPTRTNYRIQNYLLPVRAQRPATSTPAEDISALSTETERLFISNLCHSYYV